MVKVRGGKGLTRLIDGIKWCRHLPNLGTGCGERIAHLVQDAEDVGKTVQSAGRSIRVLQRKGDFGLSVGAKEKNHKRYRTYLR